MLGIYVYGYSTRRIYVAVTLCTRGIGTLQGWTPEAFQVYKRCFKRSISRCRGFYDPDSSYIKRKTTTIATIPQSSFPALPSPQKASKLKGNMIDSCITQGISDHLKWVAFRLIRIRIEYYAPQSDAAFGNPHPPVKFYSDDHIWLQRQWYAPNGENQAQVSNWIPEIWGDMLCH